MADAADADASFTCEMCYDDCTVAQSLSLCASNHRFCAECCWRCCQSALGDGLVPACPFDKQHKCGAIGKEVACAALSAWLRGDVTRKAELGDWAIGGSASKGFTSGKLDAVYLSAHRARQGAVQCIGRHCQAWYVPVVPHSTEPQRVVCTQPRCGASFCTACRQPFHFRSTCAEALRLHARWIKFLQEELVAFLMVAVQADEARWAPVLKAHTKRKGALDNATREALSRFDELRKMEIWKESHCKRCPGCKRVVEKLSGCDMMLCGNNYHEDDANRQRGCGKPFIWSEGQPNSAIPYKADLRSAADYAADEEGGGSGDGGGNGDEESSAMRERRLRRDAREEHQSAPGVAVRCAACNEPIVGPRLQCVQCEGCVELCVSCVCVAATTHGQPLKLHGGRKHPQGHCFRRARQGVMLLPPGGGGGGASASAAASLASATDADGFVELNASNVRLRPGLGTAASAAAKAAEARAAAAAGSAGQAAAATPAAGAAGASAASSAAASAGASNRQASASRKRSVHPTADRGATSSSAAGRGGAMRAASAPPSARAPRPSPAAGGAADGPIELSSDDDDDEKPRPPTLAAAGAGSGSAGGATVVDLCDDSD